MATKDQKYPQGYGKRLGIYKTAICNNVKTGRECPYGTDCNYAHCLWELAPRVENDLFKTEDCMLDQKGNCRFGLLCKFRHVNDFCFKIAENYFLLVSKQSGAKLHIVVKPRQEFRPEYRHGLRDMAEACLPALNDPAVMHWLGCVILTVP